jgi:hypothetical protein
VKKNDLDRRKNYFNFRTTDEVNRNQLAIDYIFKCKVIQLLTEVLDNLKVLNGMPPSVPRIKPQKNMKEFREMVQESAVVRKDKVSK